MGCPHATAEATEAAAPEATEASTAAPGRTPTHGYEATREDTMAVFAELAARDSERFRSAPRTCGRFRDMLSVR
jgi:hypothetical protein